VLGYIWDSVRSANDESVHRTDATRDSPIKLFFVKDTSSVIRVSMGVLTQQTVGLGSEVSCEDMRESDGMARGTVRRSRIYRLVGCRETK
jgi:hypothetical protein